MKARTISHIAIGVRDMERSLPFYRDLLGLRVMLDTVENVGAAPDPQMGWDGVASQNAIFRDPQRETRRAVYLRWEEDPQDATTILLSDPGPTSGEAIKMDQVGIHHFSFWVNDLQATYEKLKAAGVPILTPPTICDTITYGEEPGGKVLTIIFQDPDGIILQLDERM